MDWHWVWLTVAAFLAGVLNAVAGGGSFLSFPAMLGMKILPVQANATNTVALWPGQLTSIAAYREDIRKNLRLAWPMGLAGLLGGTAGALVLLNTPQMTFMRLVPWLLLVAALIFAVSGPVSRWLKRRKGAMAGSEASAAAGADVLLRRSRCVFTSATLAPARGFCLSRCFRFSARGSARDQRAEGGFDHAGQRDCVCSVRGERAGGVALLPAGDGDVRHRRV